jgi:hypothetical protein
LKLETGIDYLAFTLKTGHLPRAFELLGTTPEPLQAVEKGLYGYTFSFRCPGVTVLYSGGRGDVHIQLTGSACNFYGEKLLTMVPSDAHVSRCDLRCDVYNGFLTVDEVWGCLRQGYYSGNSRTVALVSSIKSGEYAGSTVYLGAKTSAVRLRIYDKGAESGTSKNPRRWIRYEFQARNDAAAFVYSHCQEESEESAFLNFLHKTVRLTTRPRSSVDSKKTDRLVTLPRWLRMWGCRIKTVYHSCRKTPTYQGMMKHVKNAGAILRAIRGLREDFDDIVHSICDAAVLKPRHLQFMHDFSCTSPFDYGPPIGGPV